MGQSKFKTDEFKSLKSLWYKKLKDEGFDDKESGPYLKEWDSHYFQARHEPHTFHIHHDYYYLATHFLNSHTFNSDFERQIWHLHSTGMGYREIAREIETSQTHTPHCKKNYCDLFCLIKSGDFYIANKDKVNQIIKRLKRTMLSKLNRDDE